MECQSMCEPSLGTGSRSARPAMKVCASSVSPAFGGPAETKKARHRRCFKPPWNLYKRPQARANLGNTDVCASRSPRKRKCRLTGRTRRSPVAQTEGAAEAAPSYAPRWVGKPDRFSPQRGSTPRRRKRHYRKKDRVSCAKGNSERDRTRPVPATQHLLRVPVRWRAERVGSGFVTPPNPKPARRSFR